MNFYDLLDIARGAWNRLWRWLIWSPSRLLAVVLVVLGIVLLSVSVTGDQDSGPAAGIVEDDDLPDGWEDWELVEVASDGQAPETPSPGDEDDDQSPSTEEDEPTHNQSASAGTRDLVLSIVRPFTEAWLATTRPRAQWREALLPMVTPELGEGLRTVEPLNIRATRTEGPPEIEGISDFGAVVTVPTDGGPLTLQLTNLGSEWAISVISPPEGRSDTPAPDPKPSQNGDGEESGRSDNDADVPASSGETGRKA